MFVPSPIRIFVLTSDPELTRTGSCIPARAPCRLSKFSMAPYGRSTPQVGDTLHFKYHASNTFKHKIYTDFPRGRTIKRTELFMDFSRPIVVEEVRRRTIGGSTFVAVAFFYEVGAPELLWTNFSKNGWEWMLF